MRTDGRTDRHDEANSRFSQFSERTRKQSCLNKKTESIMFKNFRRVHRPAVCTVCVQACYECFQTYSPYEMRSSLLCDVTQRRSVVCYRRFGNFKLSHVKMRLVRVPETSVTHYQSTQRNIPEERRSHYRGGSLKSRMYTTLLALLSK